MHTKKYRLKVQYVENTKKRDKPTNWYEIVKFLFTTTFILFSYGFLVGIVSQLSLYTNIDNLAIRVGIANVVTFGWISLIVSIMQDLNERIKNDD